MYTLRFEPQTFHLEVIMITTTPSRTFVKKQLFFLLRLVKIRVKIFFENFLKIKYKDF
jgi:hypothetical protein